MRLTGSSAQKSLFASAAVLGASALALAIAVPAGGNPDLPASAPLTDGGTATFSQTGASAMLSVTGADADDVRFRSSSPTAHDGADREWSATTTAHPAGRARTIDLDELVRLAGGRVPVGVDPSRAPGPYSANWTSTSRVTAYTLGGGLVDASSDVRTVVTISAGGLAAPRSFAVNGEDGSWSVKPGHAAQARASIAAARASAREAVLWKLWLPLVLAMAAVVLAVGALRSRRALRAASPDHDGTAAAAAATSTATSASADVDTRSTPPNPRSTTYAAK
jgi:high-affinity iron transporter